MLGIVFDISFIVSGITKISCFNLTALAKFTAKTRYVWQGVVVAISQRKTHRVMCVLTLKGLLVNKYLHDDLNFLTC